MSVDVQSDTIAAIATGSGRAGIGIVRVSGPAVPAICKSITGIALTPRLAHYGAFVDSDSQPIDEGISIRFDAPNSFTGEHVLELQGHGGSVILDLLLARVISLGARLARPGEFSERAFLNDKHDLAQAEAVADLIDAASTAAAQAAVRSLRGEFSHDVAAIQEELIALRVWLEAALDFSEEEIDFLANPELQNRTKQLISRFDELLGRAKQGQRLRDGLTVVIAGHTNVGKSSLLNALSGVDSAIVTDIEGTTRDVLHEHISLEGVPLHIIDTAGLRKTDDVIEQEGIDRARRAMVSADHVLVMLDADNPILPDVELPEGVAQSLLINKIDLLDKRDSAAGSEQAGKEPRDTVLSVSEEIRAGFSQTLFLSVKTGKGLTELREYLLSIAGHDSAIEGVYLARRRHLEALNDARKCTDTALKRLHDGVMPELAAEEFRFAQRSLDTISGRFDSEDLLGRIFSGFCVGK